MKEKMLEKVLNAHKNLIIDGDVASGKTTNVLFPIVDKAIENNESIFVLDSREEYLNRYYDKLKEKNYNTIILNLRDMDKSDGWNPLEYPYNLFKSGNTDKAQEYLEKIGKIIYYDNSVSDPFWSLSASDFFIGVALALFEDGKEDEINFNSIGTIFSGCDKRCGTSDFTTEYFRAKDNKSKSYVFASTTVLAPRDTKGGIVSTAKQKLRVYISREKLSQFMNKTTFDINDIVNKPTAIIMIGRDENKSLNTLCAMFIEQLYAILVDLKVSNRFNLILDNFDIVEKCNDLVDILGSCTSRNIKTYIATRSVNELENVYGSYMLKLCDLLSIGNTDVKLNINNVEEKLGKEFETVIINNANIQYPKLNTSEINIFNLENAVKDIKFVQFNNSSLGDLKLDNPFKVDDMIKSIDEKIAQLEKEEEKFKNEEKSNSNDLSGFIKTADEYVNRIDEKIAQLEKEEEMQSNENKMNSELQQFRIDENNN